MSGTEVFRENAFNALTSIEDKIAERVARDPGGTPQAAPVDDGAELPSHRSAAPDTRLDHWLPEWHFNEVHELKIDAPAAVILKAVTELTLREAPLAFMLLRLTKSKPEKDHRVVGDIAGEYMLDRTDDEIVFGGIGSSHGEPPLDRPVKEALIGFDTPGYNKLGLNFLVRDGVLRTETRVFCTDRKARRAFARYWMVIRLGSGAIRVSLLNAIRRRALNEEAA
jgi:hypothetical protein